MTEIEKLKAMGAKKTYIKAYQLRFDGGATFEDIGKVLGTTRQWAETLIKRCKPIIEDYDNGMMGLTPKARLAIHKAGMVDGENTRQKVREELEGGFMFHVPYNEEGQTWVGKKTHEAIERWANATK